MISHIDRFVFFKLFEVFFRAISVVFVAYTLEPTEAGQFGLIITLQGLASFLFGFERHIDIQRKYVGETDKVFDSAVRSAFFVFLTNYIIFLPIYFLSLSIGAEIFFYTMIVCLVIAIAEQLINFAYQIALVKERYARFLYIACIKNFIFFISLLYIWLQQKLNLETVLIIWAALAAIFTIIMFILWFSMAKPNKLEIKNIKNLLIPQYQISRSHFFIGLIAILVLQLDRLVIGLVMPLDMVGIYFRHILIVSLVYQVFNIASYNRILPNIFLLAKTETIAAIRIKVGIEYRNILVFILLLVSIFIISYTYAGNFFKHFQISPFLMLGLLFASGIRVRADLNALVFHAFYREDIVLKMQIFILLVSSLFLIVFTLYLGLAGAILATAMAAITYLLLSFINLSNLRSHI